MKIARVEKTVHLATPVHRVVENSPPDPVESHADELHTAISKFRGVVGINQVPHFVRHLTDVVLAKYQRKPLTSEQAQRILARHHYEVARAQSNGRVTQEVR